jgi:hypothetical protein
MAGGMLNYIRMLETRPPELTIRRWREVRKSTMRVMGLHWHQHMLPEHFEANASSVYHYKRRSAKYLESKQRAAQFGRRQVDSRAASHPLTLTGTLRANVTQIATIRAFENRFKLVMPGTAYTPDRPRNPRQPPLAQEVTRLLDREKQELAKLGKAHAVAELNRT